jgi:hypothetical protein
VRFGWSTTPPVASSLTLCVGCSISPQDFDIELADYFNMLAGTSTGGLLALYRES